MSEIKTSTGETIRIDLSKVTMGEWRAFFRGSGSEKSDDAFIEKITGLKPATQAAMLRDDYRRVIQAVIKAGNEPLADPNSQSASTSD